MADEPQKDAGQDGIIHYDRSVPGFLHETPEASQWLEALAEKLRSKRCGREEIAWILGVPPKNVSEAIPSSCDAGFKGTLLSQMTFVSKSTGCQIKGLSHKAYLNGRKATLCRDLQLNCPHAVVLVDGGVKEKFGEGDRSKTVQIARENLLFGAPQQDCNMGGGWPSLHVLPVSRLAALQEPGADGHCPSAKCKKEDLLGKTNRKALPKALQGTVGLKWLAEVIGRLVDSRGCHPEDLAYLLGVAEADGSEPAGLGGPHVQHWPASSLVGSMLTTVDFVPAWAVVMVQDSERAELNGRLAEVWEPCPPGQLNVRLAMAHDGDEVVLPRKHLRLLPSPIPALKLGLVPFGTRCMVEGSKTRPELNGRRVMLLEDCRPSQPHCRVYGEGLREIRIHRKNLRVVRPDPKVSTTVGAQEDCTSFLARFGRTHTVGSLESSDDLPVPRANSKASVIDSECEPEPPAGGSPASPASPSSPAAASSPTAEPAAEGGALKASADAKHVVALGGEGAEKPDETSDGRRDDSKDDIIDDGKKPDPLAEDTDPPDARDKDKSGSDVTPSKEDVDSLKSFASMSEQGSVKEPTMLPDLAGWLGGMLSLFNCGSTDRASCATCCRKDHSQELHVEGSSPSIYSPLVGDELDVEHVHPSLAPAMMGPLVISMGVAEVPPREASGEDAGEKDHFDTPIRKEQSDGGLSPSSNTPTREPAPSTAAGDTPTSGVGTPLGGGSSGQLPGPGRGQIPDAAGDAEAEFPTVALPAKQRKGLLSRAARGAASKVLGRRFR